MDGSGSAPFQINFSIEALKEPRGFIRLLEFVLSIFAFATTTSHDSSTTFHIDCDKVPFANKSGHVSVTFSYSYPYNLEDDSKFAVPLCNTTKTGMYHLHGGSQQSSAQFYVFVGVIVFIYCLATLALYILCDEFYRRNTRVILVDFIVSTVLTLFWLIGSSAWASGVTDIKMYTDPDDGSIFQDLVECRPVDKVSPCQTDSEGNFASLNVSIIFGFLNFLVWVGNLWFLYKETPWFKVQAKPPTQPGVGESPGAGNVY